MTGHPSLALRPRRVRLWLKLDCDLTALTSVSGHATAPSTICRTWEARRLTPHLGWKVRPLAFRERAACSGIYHGRAMRAAVRERSTKRSKKPRAEKTRTLDSEVGPEKIAAPRLWEESEKPCWC